MTKREFIDQLKSALNGQVPEGVIWENVRFYEQYFDEQCAQGVTEEEICEQIGSPKLIARSIIEAEKYEMDSGKSDAAEFIDDTGHDGALHGFSHHVRLSGWLGVAVLILIVFFLLWLVASIFRIMIPVIVPVVIILLGYRLIRRFIERS